SLLSFFFLSLVPRPPRSTLFPTRRSSDLGFPSWALYPMVALATAAGVIASQATISGAYSMTRQAIQLGYLPRMGVHHTSAKAIGDRKSTRLNSSHLGISYAVFCLKKKNIK